MKILHIIPSMGSGGAETMLLKLIKENNRMSNPIKMEILILFNAGFYKEELQKNNIKFYELEINKSIYKLITSPFTILKIMLKANIIHSWMYHSNVIAMIFSKILLRKKTITSIRRSSISKADLGSTTYYVAKLDAILSRKADAILSCTQVGMDEHKSFGYANKKFMVIPNGFEDVFVKSYLDKEECEDFGVYHFLNIGRWHEVKGHKILLNAFSKIKKKGYLFNLTLIGKNMNWENEELVNLIERYKLSDNITLLDERKNLYEIIPDYDFYVLSSLSEGFPNVLGETMGLGLYPIATDVGDVRYIMDDVGIICEPNNVESLEKGIEQVYYLSKEEVSKGKILSIKQISDNFLIENIFNKYKELYQDVMKGEENN